MQSTNAAYSANLVCCSAQSCNAGCEMTTEHESLDKEHRSTATRQDMTQPQHMHASTFCPQGQPGGCMAQCQFPEKMLTSEQPCHTI